MKIHKNIETRLNAMNEPRIYSPLATYHDVDVLSMFKSISEHQIEKLILDLSKESCSLDRMPTKLLLQCIEIWIPLFTSFHLFLSTGHFPMQWKNALITPLLQQRRRTVDHKVRGSSPAAALMSFGKTLIYICHTPPRWSKGVPGRNVFLETRVTAAMLKPG